MNDTSDVAPPKLSEPSSDPGPATASDARPGPDPAADPAGRDTRSALLAAGRRLFSQRGFDGTSIRAITREAGANLGAVTYHFGSKRGLYGAVLEEGLRPLAARLATAARGPGSGLERMLGVVETYFGYLERNPDLPYLLLQEIAAGKKPPPVVVEIIQRVAGTVAGIQREGVADGSVRDGHPYLTAVSVVSQPVFFTLVAPMLSVVAGVDLADPKTRAGVLAHIQAFVRAGLAAREEAAP